MHLSEMRSRSADLLAEARPEFNTINVHVLRSSELFSKAPAHLCSIKYIVIICDADLLSVKGRRQVFVACDFVWKRSVYRIR